jgi:DNA-binding NtrC family response regulator
VNPHARKGADALAALIGYSAAMQRLRAIVQRVAQSDRAVLVTGPTGSGKELAVRAIHALGRHPDEPLIDLNCGALPRSLIESQLFGHERGAFTGAQFRHDGYFSAVGEGTLFLDEIAELPLELQAELLRVLENGTFRRVGSHETLRFSGRVVAATHADLEERVARGMFREDLFYRLNVLEVHVPPLADRTEDIPALIAHFAGRHMHNPRFSAEAVEDLMRADWPGNVRQLRNLVDRIAVIAPPSEEITREVLRGFRIRTRARDPEPPIESLARAVLGLPGGNKLQLVENLLIEEALRATAGNKTAAARLLGVHRKSIERRCERQDMSYALQQSEPEGNGMEGV